MNKPTQNPADAQAFIDGSFYKIGRHGLVFRWNNFAWVASNRRAIEITRIINRTKRAAL